jgi:hypothetical protein
VASGNYEMHNGMSNRTRDREREEKAMEAFRTTLFTSVAAFLIGTASAAPRLDLVTKPSEADSISRPIDARKPDIALSRVDRAPGAPDAPAGYSPLGIAKINGRRIAIYAFQNGAKLDDLAGSGRGTAEVFDRTGSLRRRFIFRENLNSPPQITEFIYMPER